jgi:hypothetical protein
MSVALPDDLLAFLRDGRRLDYDVDSSEIGRITLKRDTDLSVATITTYPGCQSIIDDPYEDMEGLYQIDVCDLVAESEAYETEGLLCWIVSLKRFGSVDPEHGDVVTFPGVTWTELAANPLPYLDAQWDHDGVGVRVLPWLHFPFKFSEVDVVFEPYGPRCPVHGAAVAVQRTSKPVLFDVIRRREPEDWLQNYLTIFPYSGLPVSEDELLCCPDCRAAEDVWVRQVEESISPADVVPNAHGWVQCPCCGIRFLPSDSNVFKNSIHLVCGQKINIVS